MNWVERKFVAWFVGRKWRKPEMAKIRDFVNNNKTNIIMFVTFCTGGLQALGYEVPEWVYVILGSMGVVALRSGVKKAEIAAGGK